MKKRLLTAFLAAAMLVSMLTGITFAATTGTVVFFDSATNATVKKIDEADSVYAKVSFTAPTTGSAKIVTAQYDGDGALVS
ncbi:MAG: hypothetical protein IJ366_00830, partial [Clostridia bacterium]|nr:hypothetical protein [Clostridia bacterium]